jgi:hypothetical protein
MNKKHDRYGRPFVGVKTTKYVGTRTDGNYLFDIHDATNHVIAENLNPSVAGMFVMLSNEHNMYERVIELMEAEENGKYHRLITEAMERARKEIEE